MVSRLLQDDVVFSYTVLRSEAAIPTYRAYYRDIAKVKPWSA